MLRPHYLFVCTHQRNEGDPRPSCGARGGVDLAEALKARISERKLGAQVRCCRVSCLDYCKQGPNVLMMPEHRILHGVETVDIDRILDEVVGVGDGEAPR